MTEKSRQKFKYFEYKKEFLGKHVHHFKHFHHLSVAKNYFSTESAPLIISVFCSLRSVQNIFIESSPM